MKIFSSFPCGNLLLVYFQSENIFDFCLIPSAMQDQIILENKSPESMIQFKLSDSPFGSGFAHTMRNSPCLNELKFVSQEEVDSRIITRFQYGNGLSSIISWKNMTDGCAFGRKSKIKPLKHNILTSLHLSRWG